VPNKNPAFCPAGLIQRKLLRKKLWGKFMQIFQIIPAERNIFGHRRHENIAVGIYGLISHIQLAIMHTHLANITTYL
jgi:hypothetical protein